MLYGASYYLEYQPYERLEDDIRLMSEAGISAVRMGDSIWSLCEPEDGRFDFEWLARVLDALHDAGIQAILVTPTYAIPPWLHRRYPEVMARYAQGRRAYFGARQNMDLTHPAYLFHAERIIRALVSRFAAHPAVIGWQVDNETRHGILYNPGVFQRFVDYLRAKFGSYERLNEIWGLNYWSHRLHAWEDLWTPDGNTNPGYDLEWRRFQAALITEFLAWQARIVRELARPDQFITQDLVGGHGLPESDRYAIAQVVDILAENPYHPTQDGLLLPAPPADGKSGPFWMYERDVSSLFFKGDLGWSGRQSNFLVTELNAISVGGSADNYPAYDGQWRLAAYAFISRGANAILYWHWHTLHYGAETYWGGILNHDLEPGRCFREISRIAHELREHGDLLTDIQVDADVALLYSQDSRYAFEFQPCLNNPATGEGDPRSYQRIFGALYRACFDARVQTAIVHPAQDFEHFRVLVVPAAYIASDALLDRLAGYVEGGGHLLLTFRTGYADEHARARPRRAPDRLRQAVGASYNEYSNLARPLPLRVGDGGLSIPGDAMAHGWADGLELEGATPLAYYDHPHFGKFPAIVSQPFGRGRVTYCGTLPNSSLGTAVLEWVMAQAGVVPPGTDLPEPVRLTSARALDGRRLWFCSNWSFEPQAIAAVPHGGQELFSGAPVAAGDELSLAPWDMQIIVEG